MEEISQVTTAEYGVLAIDVEDKLAINSLCRSRTWPTERMLG